MVTTTQNAIGKYWGLSNLTAPASGVVHGATWSIVQAASGSVVLNMNSQMQVLGDFQGQAMAFDNSANGVSVTITETTFGWTRTVPAGTYKVFQYPGVRNQVFTFTASAAINATATVYDWPAFPDQDINTAVATGAPVIVSGNVNVTQGTTPWVTGGPSLTPAVGDNFSIAHGGTAQVVFAIGDVSNFAIIGNPGTATESLWFDITGTAAQTAQPGTAGTTLELPPGQSYVIPGPLLTNVSIVGVTTGHTFTAIKA